MEEGNLELSATGTVIEFGFDDWLGQATLTILQKEIEVGKYPV